MPSSPSDAVTSAVAGSNSGKPAAGSLTPTFMTHTREIPKLACFAQSAVYYAPCGAWVNPRHEVPGADTKYLWTKDFGAGPAAR